MEEGLDQINQDIKDAEKNIDDLEKCCGLFVLPWRRQKLTGEGAKAARDTWKKRAEGGAQLGEGPRIAISDDRPSSNSGLHLCSLSTPASFWTRFVLPIEQFDRSSADSYSL